LLASGKLPTTCDLIKTEEFGNPLARSPAGTAEYPDKEIKTCEASAVTIHFRKREMTIVRAGPRAHRGARRRPMMKTAYSFGAAVLAVNCVIASAGSADCVNREDMSALRTAAMQQELMVAALTCHDVRRYNRFVVSHQGELVDSDNRLKAFFIQRGGEARYHTFKTELANDASLRSIRETQSFCADARDRFDLAERPISLAAFVAREPVSLGGPYRSCHEYDRDAPMTADSSPIPRTRHAEMSDDDRPAWTRDRYARRHNDADADRRDSRDDGDDDEGDGDN